MHKITLTILILVFLQSCIPLKVAPKIENYKVVKGKKFKRWLPKRQMFIFEDNKDSNQFYHYVNNKFQLGDLNVEDNVPFTLQGKQYFFSFYEVSKDDQALNLAPMIIEALISSATKQSYDAINGPEVVGKGNFYIAIEVYSDDEFDCLEENSFSRTAVLEYLSALKNEYLSTENYNGLVFKN
ncbi:hypothetical protein [Spongiimicrobium salis]|uniref:hypothetical protein n=1 Tax=Spongiimicrobium salis TaxID=1667022 RepID=UPI00374C8AFA